MPPSDQEPRYQLVDSNGNVVGSLFGDGSGNVVIADETDTQTTFDANGISTPALEATELFLGQPSKSTEKIYTEVFDKSFNNETIDETVNTDGGYNYIIKVENFREDVGTQLRMQIEGRTASAYRNIIEDGSGSTTTSSNSFFSLNENVGGGIWETFEVGGSDKDYPALIGGGVGSELIADNKWLRSGVLRRDEDFGNMRFFTTDDIGNANIKVLREIDS